MALQHNDVEQVFRALAARLGGSLTKAKREYQLDPFLFVINYLPATASATTSGNFIVQNDSAFAICKGSYIATDITDAAISGLQPFGSGALTSLAPFLITMTDSGSGRAMSNDPVPIDSWFGTGQRIYTWTIPKVLDPASTFAVTVQNLSATDRRVRLAFHGYKVFGNLQAFNPGIQRSS